MPEERRKECMRSAKADVLLSGQTALRYSSAAGAQVKGSVNRRPLRHCNIVRFKAVGLVTRF